jgi:hypothetical protein
VTSILAYLGQGSGTQYTGAVTRRLVLLLAPLLALTAGEKKSSGGPSIRVVKVNVRRLTGQPLIAIDGRISNSGAHPIRELTLIFDVLGMDGQVVSRQRGKVDADPLDPGEVSEFHWQMRDEARAVEIRIRGVARREERVTVENPGPYTIE